MNFYPANASLQPSLAGTTLIMPGPNALGFVGQLTLDLLISTLKLQKVGSIDCPDVSAVVGIDSYGPWDSPSVRTAMEVYQGKTQSSQSHSIKEQVVTVLMIRSKVEKEKGMVFSEALTSWIQSIGFSRVLLLTALDGTRRTDKQLGSSPLRYCTVGSEFSDQFPAALKLGWTAIESSSDIYTDTPCIIPPGGGLTRFILNEFKRKEMSLTVLSWFTFEGDNMDTVHSIANAVNDLVCLCSPKPQWLRPKSWDHIYGQEQYTRELF
ncbi:hypothetical protein BATDEDRAFT_88091 [Batrachochytrium dendrobatidis JAM81]|uniref:Proteasome assembly chaperone 2 n=2 Tax=Batrachochytrium dendrobatidis TaxID=109871 RepID=F4P1Y9_BATDJ|nr:uncharacterized protein BATDEDRAFT_88091 [Batrachochytrium dendrobatidis JAM81]EGF81019.1 hypothetical protein BATDEDRAFT_88091 [Batrachochytrium dendrobatidis JAM81]|eukprot:XP_006678786.1 hypothetical protein BATDEDRAFT_88091 [Batrachochytrium dendrobatidis JAM81]